MKGLVRVFRANFCRVEAEARVTLCALYARCLSFDSTKQRTHHDARPRKTPRHSLGPPRRRRRGGPWKSWWPKQFVSRIEGRLSGKTGPGKAFRAPSSFKPTASGGNMKLAGSLKHVNAMVEVVVQAGRTDFNRLKRRVTHYTAIAEKQRTGI